MDFPRLWPAPASAGRDIFDRDTPAAPHREPAPACRGCLRRPARRRAASRRPGRAGRASRPRDSRDPVMRTGIIGGRLGYRLLRRLGARTQATATDERADVILSIDGFEHYDDPEQVLRVLRRLLKDDGRVFIAFGPPWLHPLGGHLFSVFPWAHLLFTENALIRWRSDFKSDGATRFSEVAGGLNRRTVRRFRSLLERCDFAVERFEAVPIKRLRALSNVLTREFVTAMVRCELTPRPAQRERAA